MAIPITLVVNFPLILKELNLDLVLCRSVEIIRPVQVNFACNVAL